MVDSIVPSEGTWPIDNCTYYGGIPDSIDAAYRVPGSTSWNMKEGCYTVCTFNTHMEDFETVDPYAGLVMTGGNTKLDLSTIPALYTGGITTIVGGTEGGYGRTGKGWYKTHLNHSGSYGTGLAKEVNFALTLKADLEIIPNGSSILVDFIKAGVPASPSVKKLYAEMARAIPASVPVADNDAGDFFKKMIKVAGPIVGTLFPAAKPLVAGGQAALTKGVDALSQRRKNKKALQANSNGKKSTRTVNVTDREYKQLLMMRGTPTN
jgi:hypothetical protein